MKQNNIENPSRQTIIRQIETLNKSIRTKEGRLAVLLKEIENNIKQNEIIKLERFTYEDYIHGEATPTPNTIWEDRYKLFYKIPKNIEITIKEKELDK